MYVIINLHSEPLSGTCLPDRKHDFLCSTGNPGRYTFGQIKKGRQVDYEFGK